MKLPVDYEKHAITFLSFYGKELLSTQGNLFEVIQKSARRLVVDNHIDWFRLSGLLDNSNTAFILGTTTDRESSPLRLLVEDKFGNPKVRQNVFMFGMKSPTHEDILDGHRTPLLVISQLDEYAIKIFDVDGIRKFEQPGGEKVKWNSSQSIADEKEKVLSLLSIKRIEEIDQMPARQRQTEDEKLRLSIERNKPRCFKRFWESNDVARFAYSRLLLFSKKTRNEFANANYPNVFGDLHLVQNALFFNAEFASNDAAVMKMAKYCGLQKFGMRVSEGRCACQ